MQIFNTGDYLKAVEQKIASETISKVLYPVRRRAAGAGAAPPPGVLPGRLRDARHRRPVPAGSPDLRRLSGEGRRSSERHASCAGHRRVDAHPRRRARPALGHRLADHAIDDGLHESHAVAGGAREVAGGPARARRAAAPANHLRDQSALPGTRRLRLARRRRASATDVSHRGRGLQAGAHGAPEHRRQPFHQRRVRAAQPARPDDAGPRTSTPSGRNASTTRRTASRRAAGWCRPIRSWPDSSPGPSATRGSPTSNGSASWNHARTTAHFGRSSAPSSAPTRSDSPA